MLIYTWVLEAIWPLLEIFFLSANRVLAYIKV